MTIIEVDGVNHNALTVDSIQIFAGQRYSFIVGVSHALSLLSFLICIPA